MLRTLYHLRRGRNHAGNDGETGPDAARETGIDGELDGAPVTVRQGFDAAVLRDPPERQLSAGHVEAEPTSTKGGVPPFDCAAARSQYARELPI